MIRVNVTGCSNIRRSLGLRELRERLPVGDLRRGAAEHPAHLLVGEAGGAGGLQRDHERGRLLAVREVGGEERLLGREAPVDVEQVDRAPHGRVVEDARVPRERVRERAEVGDAAVGDDQLRPRVPVDEPLELLGDRRQAAASVDQDRHAALGREREDPVEPLVVQVERLRAGMELDAAGAEVEAAGRLGDGLGGQVEADERDEDAVARLRGRERPVVRGPERGLAIGLVQAEGEARA